MLKFPDRSEAGKTLGLSLADYKNQKDVIVLGLPRGGVPVAYQVAISLHAPLDVFIVRKLGVPGHSEFAMGAISMGGVKVLNFETILKLQISQAEVSRVIQKEEKELLRREEVYRGTRAPLNVKNKTVILIDDGIATGASMDAAILALRQLEPKALIVAVPVAPLDACHKIAEQVDKFICLLRPEDFYAVGAHYEDFPQTEDGEVMACLSKANAPSKGG